MESIHSTSRAMHSSSFTSQSVLDLDLEENIDPQSKSQLESAPIKSSDPKAKTKRVGSIAWLYCTKVQKFNEKRKEMWPYARCNFCQIEFPAHSAHNGTTHIVKHLKEVCVKCPAYEGGANSKRQSILTQGAMGAPLIPHTFN